MPKIDCPHCGHANSVPAATDGAVPCEHCRGPVVTRSAAADPAPPAGSSPTNGPAEGEVPWYVQLSAEVEAPAPVPPVDASPQPPAQPAPRPEPAEPARGSPAGGATGGGPNAADPHGWMDASAPGAAAGEQGTVPAPGRAPGAGRSAANTGKSRGGFEAQPRPVEARPPHGAPPAAAPEPLPLGDWTDDGPHTPSPGSTTDPGAPPRRAWKVYAVVGGLAVIVAGVGVAAAFLGKDRTEAARSTDAEAAKPAPREGASPADDERREFKPEEIAERLIPSTVLIVTRAGDKVGIGSGVLVHRSPNVVLTNWHVVEDAKDKTTRVFFPDRDAKGKVVTRLDHYLNKDALLGTPGKVVAHDPERDIAMLQLDRVPDTAVPIPLAAESAKQLERVFGNGQSGKDYGALWQSNEGSCRQLVDDFPFRVGYGVSRVLLTSQPVNPGDSGGPVVNNRLELVGIVRAKADKFISLLEKSKGLQVEGLDNFSLVVDVEELRAHLGNEFRLAFKAPFVNPAGAVGPGPDGRRAARRRTVEELLKVLETGTPHQVTLATTEIAEHGAAAVPGLIAMLGNPQQRGNWPKVLDALGQIGTPAGPAVDGAIRCLKDDYLKTRVAAARFLGSLPEGKKALPDLWKAVGSNDAALGEAAQASIRAHGPYDQTQKAWLRQLAGIPGNPNPFVKAFYVRLLCDMSDMSAKEFSEEVNNKEVNIFEDNDQRLRGHIAALIKANPGRFTRSDKFRCLIPLLGDEDRGVQDLARSVLDDMTWDKKRELLLKDVYIITDSGRQPFDEAGYDTADTSAPGATTLYREVTTSTTSKSGKTTSRTEKRVYQDSKGNPQLFQKIRNTSQEDVDVLLQHLNEHTPAEGVVYAMQLIQQMKGRGQVDYAKVKVFLNRNKYHNIKVQAATLLMIFEQKKPIDPILEELVELSTKQADTNTHTHIRRLAILSLAFVHREDARILKVFFDGLDDADGEVRGAAKTALTVCLASRLNRFDGDLRLACDTLAQSKQPEARMMAARVLANARGRAADGAQQLVAALGDPDLAVRVAAVQALGHAGPAAAPGVEKIGGLLLHELDKDVAFIRAANIKFAKSISQLGDGDKQSLDDFKGRLERQYGLKSDSAEALLQNLVLRQEALTALVNLDGHARAALPSLAAFASKTTDAEHKVLVLGAIRNVFKDPAVDCDRGLVETLVNLFQGELANEAPRRGQVFENLEALEQLVETNNRKRSPVSNAALDAFREMGSRALPHIREFLLNKNRKRANPSVNSLQIMGAVEAVAAVASRDGFRLDADNRDKLMGTLAEIEKYHTDWMPKLRAWNANNRDIEVFGVMTARITEARRLLGMAPTAPAKKKD